MTISGVTPTTRLSSAFLRFRSPLFDLRSARPTTANCQLPTVRKNRLACARLSPLATSYPPLFLLVLLSAFTFQVSSLSSWAQTKSTPKPDPFAKLAKELAEEAPGEEVNIGVGNFAYENTDLLSPFSSMLRDELEIALGETGKFKVVTRDRLADLQMEGKFQGKGVLEPGTGVDKVSIEGVKGIVRGRFYANGDEVTVFAELAWLEGG